MLFKDNTHCCRRLASSANAYSRNPKLKPFHRFSDWYDRSSCRLTLRLVPFGQQLPDCSSCHSPTRGCRGSRTYTETFQKLPVIYIFGFTHSSHFMLYDSMPFMSFNVDGTERTCRIQFFTCTTTDTTFGILYRNAERIVHIRTMPGQLLQSTP